ncbi:hypothetical protein HZY62_12055 [Maribacter polysiphoniae]|uniref:Outer membrane lipoprotein-sorting protein n=1 Tax=Maribacter polysiphoniae TaxID=429344 RepID=A0A316EKE6_9FLAO|nr:hypothetical protein [Maribacter polysiphoniae]MBD1261328.1 hypothetical protein [Maribacter polysiphoniae]PWK23430.1 hypothetical protein LX92_01995 [Maribacter polysiphoniae]
MIKKLLKIGLVLSIILLVGAFVIYLIYNEPVPVGQPGPQADALAHKMVNAVNGKAYSHTRYIEWSFRDGKHRYKWDKELGKVSVTWDDTTVNLNLNNPQKSQVTKVGEVISDTKKRKSAIEKSISMFNNDSFWLVAPFKVFDKGVVRSMVNMDDGTEALLVSYTSGGSTPGDSYLWELQPNGFPKSFKMWVSIIPLGGIKATWDDWQLTESGAFLPKAHQLGPMTIDMGDVKGYN